MGAPKEHPQRTCPPSFGRACPPVVWRTCPPYFLPAVCVAGWRIQLGSFYSLRLAFCSWYYWMTRGGDKEKLNKSQTDT
jgi:hypothetical protein